MPGQPLMDLQKNRCVSVWGDLTIQNRVCVCACMRACGHSVAQSGLTLHGLFQARILEWVACPPPGNLSHPEIKPRSPALQADSLPSEP